MGERDVHNATTAARTGAVSEVPRVGERIDRYLIVDVIGQGGMGVVLEAYDSRLKRNVALKLVFSDEPGSEGPARLLREAEAMARLAHPNVVPVHDAGEIGGRVFIAMERVEGQTLAQWLEAERTVPEILSAFLGAAEGLLAAHDAGIVHRDFKPENVLIGDDGRVRVTDFGLARTGDAIVTTQTRAGWLDASLTQTGCVMGTPFYMAPEQWRGELADTRADQYSFAASLFEALYGEAPYVSDNWQILRDKVLAGELEKPHDARVPSWLFPLVARALRVDPGDRFESLRELADALSTDPVAARRQSRRRVGLVAVIAVMTGAACIASWQSYEDSCLGRANKDINRVWNAERRDAVAAVFDQSKLPYAQAVKTTALRTVEEAVQRWTSASVRACRLNEEPFKAAQRRACLSAYLDPMDRVITRLSDPQEVQWASHAIESLPSPQVCLHDRSLTKYLDPGVRPPVDPAHRELIAVASELLRDAGQMKFHGHWNVARGLGQEAVEVVGPTDYLPYLVHARQTIAEAEEALGNQQVAQQEFDRVRELVDQLPETHPARFSYLTSYGVFVGEGGQYARAKELLEEAMDASGGTNTYTRRMHAHYQMRLGDDRAAKDALNLLLVEELALLGPRHPDVGATLNVLGLLYAREGNLDKALEFYEESISIKKESFGARHPTIANTLSNLGNTKRRLGDLDGARADLELSKELWAQTYGLDSMKVAIAANNLGAVFYDLAEYDEAAAEFEDALAIKLNVYGPMHPSTATAYKNLGELHQKLEDHATAIEYLEAAADARLKTMGADAKYDETLQMLSVSRAVMQ